MLTTALLGLLTITPHQDVPSQHVDTIERNWYYDENANLVFCQYIFWDWDGDDRICVSFRMVKHENKHAVVERHPLGYRICLSDGYATREYFRLIIAKHFHESWTQFDPEAETRNGLVVYAVDRKELIDPEAVRTLRKDKRK